MKMHLGSMTVMAGACVLLLLAACTTAPKSVEGKIDIEADAATALAKARAADPTLSELLRTSEGYAVFPSIGKGGAGVGGAYGKGVLYQDGRVVGYCDVSQGTIGLQLGGQAYTQIIAFEDRRAVQAFKEGNMKFSAQATAVALRSGAGANAKFTDGVAVFTMDEAGLMGEAVLGGQKFSYQRK